MSGKWVQRKLKLFLAAEIQNHILINSKHYVKLSLSQISQYPIANLYQYNLASK